MVIIMVNIIYIDYYFDTEITFRPLSTIAKSVTAFVCPTKVPAHCPDSADQILIRKSAPQLNTTFSLGNQRQQ